MKDNFLALKNSFSLIIDRSKFITKSLFTAIH